MPSVMGEYRLSAFGEDLATRLRSGRTVVETPARDLASRY
jgi:hypothetical protein